MKNVKTLFIDLNIFKSNPEHYTKLITSIPPFDVLNKENIEQQLNNQVFWCLVLVNNEPATCCRITNLDSRKTVYINRQIDTVPKFQGKGYGTICLLASEEHLAKIGCKKLVSNVLPDNVASIKMHKKAGYTPFEKSSYRKMSYYFNKDAIMFEKALTKQHIKENSIMQK